MNEGQVGCIQAPDLPLTIPARHRHDFSRPFLIVTALFKATYEILATPITYWVVGCLKRVEGVDTFDSETRFQPFWLEV